MDPWSSRSASQIESWFAQISLLERESNSVAELIRIDGQFDANKLATAIQSAFAEFDTMEIRFWDNDGQLVQCVDPSIKPNYHFVDLKGYHDPSGAMREWISKDLCQSHDLLNGNLSTFALFNLALDKYAWYGRAHHVIMDGFSGVLWARRVASIYAGCSNKTHQKHFSVRFAI